LKKDTRDILLTVVTVGLFISMFYSVFAINLPALWQGGAPVRQYFPGWDNAPTGPEDPRQVANYMFGDYALALEILSVVLLVALVGALVLAKPEKTDADLEGEAR
jgi:NADH:ubiquinone oxidoreductase subunit 6 (subunit J)